MRRSAISTQRRSPPSSTSVRSEGKGDLVAAEVFIEEEAIGDTRCKAVYTYTRGEQLHGSTKLVRTCVKSKAVESKAKNGSETLVGHIITLRLYRACPPPSLAACAWVAGFKSQMKIQTKTKNHTYLNSTQHSSMYALST